MLFWQKCLTCNREPTPNSSTMKRTIAYYPYGSVIANLGTGTTGQPFKFGDKELVTDNGLNEYDFESRQISRHSQNGLNTSMDFR